MVKQKTVPATPNEVQAVLKVAEGVPFYDMLFYIASKTGRRLGEYMSIQVKDIDWEKNIMICKVNKTRRRDVYRDIQLDEKGAYMLKTFIASHALKMEDYPFQAVSERAVQFAVKKYAKKAGLQKNFTFHNFRHYFVTELLKKGWSYDQIVKVTGHRSITSLAWYDHAVPADLRAKLFQAMETM